MHEGRDLRLAGLGNRRQGDDAFQHLLDLGRRLRVGGFQAGFQFQELIHFSELDGDRPGQLQNTRLGRQILQAVYALDHGTEEKPRLLSNREGGKALIERQVAAVAGIDVKKGIQGIEGLADRNLRITQECPGDRLSRHLVKNAVPHRHRGQHFRLLELHTGNHAPDNLHQVLCALDHDDRIVRHLPRFKVRNRSEGGDSAQTVDDQGRVNWNIRVVLERVQGLEFADQSAARLTGPQRVGINVHQPFNIGGDNLLVDPGSRGSA